MAMGSLKSLLPKNSQAFSELDEIKNIFQLNGYDIVGVNPISADNYLYLYAGKNDLQKITVNPNVADYEKSDKSNITEGY